MDIDLNRQKTKSLLFFLSQPFPHRPSRSQIEIDKINYENINSPYFQHLLSSNQVIGFIHKSTCKTDLFPPQKKQELSRIYQQTALKNMEILGATIQLLRVFSEAAIPAVPLKGATASDLIFKDFGVYPSGDIDILVHPSDLVKTKTLLRDQAGFTQIDQIAEKDLLSSHYHLIFRKNNILLEVHWNLVKRYFDVPADFWWNDAKEIEWNGVCTFELQTEKYLLYNFFRLFDHCFYPLRFFILIHGIIHQNRDNLDWKKLLRLADRFKMKNLVIFSLKLLKEMYQTDIPAHLLQTGQVRYNRFRSLVFSGIFTGIEQKHRKMMGYTILLIAPEALSKILLKRIFPSLSELRMRYNIPSGARKVYLYYILNPFLLLIKKNQ